MRSKSLLLVSCLLATFAHGQEPKVYRTGKLVQMDLARCGADRDIANDSAGESRGIQSNDSKTQERLCPDYLLQGEEIIYRIRPRNAKHLAPLPIGEWAQFRMDKDNVILHVLDNAGKEHEYIVVSITARGDGMADTRPVRLNHLQ